MPRVLFLEVQQGALGRFWALCPFVAEPQEMLGRFWVLVLHVSLPERVSRVVV